MGLRNYFSGRSGCLFWLNVLLALVLLAGIPYAAYNSLDIFTHHGEKIRVPQVMSMDGEKAMAKLRKADLKGVVFDSIYDPKHKSRPGIVLSQSPHAGNIVKSGRAIYLTLQRSGEPPVRIPDMIRNVSERLGARQLTDLGFIVGSPSEIVYNEPKGLLLGIRQRGRVINSGDMLNNKDTLTLIVGGGDQDSTSVDFGVVDNGNFNVEL